MRLMQDMGHTYVAVEQEQTSACLHTAYRIRWRCQLLLQAISNSHFEEEHARHRTSGQIFLGAQASRLLRKRPRWPRSQGTRERSRPATAVVCLADSQNENCCQAMLAA